MTAPTLWAGEETLVPGALRGYRSWRVKGKGLHSTGVSNRWDGPELSARCLNGSKVGGQADCDCDLCVADDHKPPVRDCSCGVYGWYDPADSRLVEADVFGVVEATGRAVMASHGFRAEKARIVALAIEPIDPYRGMRGSFTYTVEDVPSASDLHEIARWAKTQNIPVFASRKALLDAYPPQDVSSLVAHECSPECQAHREHGSHKSLLSSYMHTMSYNLPISSGYLTLTTGSSGYTSPPEPEPPKCRTPLWVCFALLAIVLFGMALGIATIIAHGFRATTVLPLITNTGLSGYWGYHFREKHWARRTKKTATNLNSETSDDDVEDEAA